MRTYNRLAAALTILAPVVACAQIPKVNSLVDASHAIAASGLCADTQSPGANWAFTPTKGRLFVHEFASHLGKDAARQAEIEQGILTVIGVYEKSVREGWTVERRRDRPRVRRRRALGDRAWQGDRRDRVQGPRAALPGFPREGRGDRPPEAGVLRVRPELRRGGDDDGRERGRGREGPSQEPRWTAPRGPHWGQTGRHRARRRER